VASHAKALDAVVAAGKRDASIDVTPLTRKPPPAPKRATVAPAATPPPPRAPQPQRIDRELQNLWAFRMWEVAGRCVLPPVLTSDGENSDQPCDRNECEWQGLCLEWSCV
jgi:type IV secretory pathway VirB10-like protein